MSRTAGAVAGPFFRRLGAVLATVACAAGVDAWFRGEPVARVASFACLGLVLPALIAAVALHPFDRQSGRASAIATGLVLVAAGNSAMSLHSDLALFALTPMSIVRLSVAALLFLLALVALRALFLRSFVAVPPTVRVLSARAFAALAAGLVVVGAFPPSAASSSPVTVARGGPSIVLVTVDTLRADHLSTYGYRAHSTLNIDRLAREGLQFDSAFAPSPWTLASLASLMTGEYPSVFGIDKHTGIPPEFPTLAASLRSAGYVTQAIVTNIYLERPYHLDAGFDGYDHVHDLGIYDDLSRHPLYRFAQKVKFKLRGDHAGRVTDRALAWLATRPHPEQPFFLWLHYMDPHQPYGGFHVAGDLPCASSEAPEIGALFTRARFVRRGELDLTPVQREHLVHLYDAEIRFVDRHLGRLLDALGASGLETSTLLVVTSDHGEEFWDHGGFEHGHSLHQEVTRVPLLARWPGHLEAGNRIGTPVTLLDLMPTFLAVAGAGAAETQGRFLPGFGHDAEAGAVLSENLLYGPERKAARDEHHALFLDPAGKVSSVYDRSSDPLERTPIAADAAPELARFVAGQIDRNAERFAQVEALRPARVSLTDFQREQLRALGYVD